MRLALLILFTFVLAACTVAAPEAQSDPSDRFFDLRVDEGSGKVFATLPDADETGLMLRAIHAGRLSSGLGSNPVGLDRGGLGSSGRIVAFRKVGDRVVLEQENWNYRADSKNPMELRAVRESFAPSILASLPMEDGAVDLTGFLTSDALGLVQYLKDAEQGSFTLDADRTYVDAKGVLAFPENVEIDVVTTLSTSDPGREVATTAASVTDVTLTVHHSFVRLPDEGYTPLRSDTRAGAIEIVHYDYSAPLSAPIETRLAVRHRIRRDDDGNIVPIVYYIDGGAPEPVRGALVDGAKWWEAAFAEAGYPDAYRVEVLPADIHPLDARYNVVQWVHRQTRGWSYGGGLLDPRTGERLKGHVNLGSLRVRQDRMIFEGLLGADKTDSGGPDDPVQLALARIRQLSAHEVGHSLGFAHNFAASTDGKASVMDYPAPDVRLVEGELDVSNAYGVGLGAWDLAAADWLYGDHTEDERDAILRDAYASGLTYVADTDGRGVGTAHPDGSTWDNGADPVATLREVMAVRAHALERFGPGNLPPGRPQSDLQAALVPIYLYHRYQTAAAAKLIGGMRFDYGPAGSAQAAEFVAPDRQRAALDAVLATVEPDALDLPDALLERLTPRLTSYSFADSDRELFKATAGPAFDVTAAADTAASLTFDALLHPQRLARLAEFHRRDPENPGVDEVLKTIRDAVMNNPDDPRLMGIAETVRARFAAKLAETANGDSVLPVKAAAGDVLGGMALEMSVSTRSKSDQYLAEMILDSMEAGEPIVVPVSEPARLPPGSPIGTD